MRTLSPRTIAAAAASCAFLAAEARAGDELVTYDLSAVVALAEGAVAGLNLETPVRGFELLLLKDGKVIHHRPYGTWWIGRAANADSATKTLSGALIMSLVDSSPVPFSLDSRLSDFIPAFTGAASAITIRQCFSHTSGYGQTGAESNPNVTLQQAALLIAATPLQHPPPGSTFAYAGTSMHAAGAAAELAGGAPWTALFAQRLTGPLGMGDTRFVLTTPSNPRIAGGCESTARDFGRFMEMLRRGGVHEGTRVLSEASVSAMFTRQTTPGIPIAHSPIQSPLNTDRADYGVGVWLDQRSPQGELLGAIAAGARGFASWIDFDDGVVGVFATDLTLSANTQPFLNLLRAATEQAVRTPSPCRVDFNASGSVSVQDLYDYLSAWTAGSAAADFGGEPGVSVQDLYDFLGAWNAGCV